MNRIIEIKSDILQYGVNFEPYDLFTKYEQIEKYKTKKIIKNPKIMDDEVYDISKDENVIPSEILLHCDGRTSIVKLRYNPSSIICIKMKEDRLIIIKNGIEIKEISAEMIKKYNVLELETQFRDGHHIAKIKEFIDIVGVDRITVLFFDGCYNWNCGKPCKFCDLHPKEKQDYSFRPNVNDVKKYKDVKEWWDKNKVKFFDGIRYGIKQILENIKFEHKHLLLMAGNLINSENVWNIAEETISDMVNYIDFNDFDIYLNIAPHDSLERLKKIKKLGIKQVQYNLEIANKELFEYACPGKTKYNEFVEKLKEAVEIMGPGNVRSNFVLGLQNIDELLKEIEELAKAGIVADYSIFQPKKGTEYYNKKAPSFEEVRYFTERLVEIYIKYGFKPIYCSKSSRSSIVNELYEEKNCRNI